MQVILVPKIDCCSHLPKVLSFPLLHRLDGQTTCAYEESYKELTRAGVECVTRAGVECARLVEQTACDRGGW